MVFEYRLEGGIALSSMIGASLIMLANFIVVELRSHPYNMISTLSFCDFFFSLKYAATAIYPDSCSLLKIPEVCLIQALMTQFFALSSVGWIGMLAFNVSGEEI